MQLNVIGRSNTANQISHSSASTGALLLLAPKPQDREQPSELNQTGILVTSGTSNGSTVSYNWNELFGIYRQLGCIYLYVSVKQAFLLPDGCGDASDEEVWQFITAHLPKEKLHR